jgi:F-type H+-transporting ATPase subunit gamma
MYLAGTKAFRYFSRKRRDIKKTFLSWEARDSLAGEITGFLTGEFKEKHFDELYCIYTQSISMMTQRVVTEKILPLEKLESRAASALYLFEPEPEQAINIILPLFLREYIMKILLDARTAEMASRLNAMSNATDNAEKLVGELRLNYFRARQENITTEILEITSGAESQKNG